MWPGIHFRKIQRLGALGGQWHANNFLCSCCWCHLGWQPNPPPTQFSESSRDNSQYLCRYIAVTQRLAIHKITTHTTVIYNMATTQTTTDRVKFSDITAPYVAVLKKAQKRQSVPCSSWTQAMFIFLFQTTEPTDEYTAKSMTHGQCNTTLSPLRYRESLPIGQQQILLLWLWVSESVSQ